MDDIVAARVTLQGGKKSYVLTWGRIFDRIEENKLIEVIRDALVRNGIPKKAHIQLCDSLQEASKQRYFYEAFFAMSQTKILFGRSYEKWRARMKQKMLKGKEIFFL